MLRFALLESVAGGEVEEGLSSLGDGGEDEAEVSPSTTLRGGQGPRHYEPPLFLAADLPTGRQVSAERTQMVCL